jgi:CRISPR-associated protein Csm5
MNELGHLKIYHLKLTAKAPIFIGSGKEYNKKEYYYDRKCRRVNIINTSALFSLLVTRSLVDEYERYILNRPGDDLYRFFSDIQLSQKDIDDITEYTADVSDALAEEKSLSAIGQFIRDRQNRPYIPGSSVKGCMRTVLLWKLINSDRKSFDSFMKTKEMEAAYLNTVTLNRKKPSDEGNSIMRGISISDSEFIDNSRMILTKKVDRSTAGNKNTINTIREAIAPGTEIDFTLTLDEAVSGLKVDFIREAIREYGEYYKKSFANSFRLPEDSEKESFQDCVVLGGGSGYFGKNIVYPLYSRTEAVRKVSKIMMDKFPKHHHERDIALGISPHMIKHTSYASKSYHYGVCKVEII